jgi:hypothetical protein
MTSSCLRMCKRLLCPSMGVAGLPSVGTATPPLSTAVLLSTSAAALPRMSVAALQGMGTARPLAENAISLLGRARPPGSSLPAAASTTARTAASMQAHVDPWDTEDVQPPDATGMSRRKEHSKNRVQKQREAAQVRQAEQRDAAEERSLHNAIQLTERQLESLERMREQSARAVTERTQRAQHGAALDM